MLMMVLLQMNIATVVDADRSAYAPYRECVMQAVMPLVSTGSDVDDIVLAARSKCRNERTSAMIKVTSNDLDLQNATQAKFPGSPHLGMTPDEMMSEMDSTLREDVAAKVMKMRQESKNAQNQ